MENLTKAETQAVVDVLTAAIKSRPSLPKEHPLKRAKDKLSHNLTLFKVDPHVGG